MTPLAWMHVQGNHFEPSLRQLDDDEKDRGWTQFPLCAPLFTQQGAEVAAPVQPSPDALDARRYRWLRDDERGRALSVSGLEWRNDPALCDVAIDAAMLAKVAPANRSVIEDKQDTDWHCDHAKQIERPAPVGEPAQQEYV